MPEQFHHQFQMVVIDPPFVTRDVWEKYAEAARLLLVPEGGKILLSTLPENKDMLAELLQVRRLPFQPSIPHLVYQYDLYANYETTALNEKNSEIPDYDDY